MRNIYYIMAIFTDLINNIHIFHIKIGLSNFHLSRIRVGCN